MRSIRTLLSSLVAFGGFAAPAFADDVVPLPTEDAVLRIPRAERPPILEEYIGGVPEHHGVVITDFRQNKPGDGVPVSLPTTAYVSYDDDNLYVVFVCKDDPKLVRARIARREDIFGDEGVQFFVDSFNDNQRAFVFATNPHGVQLDSKLTEGLGYDYDFDTQWKSDGRLTPDGFVVTMSVPFKSLRFERGPSQTWGFAIGRIVPRNSDFSYWPYITERKEGFITQFADAIIEHDIQPGRNIQVIPYTSYRDVRALEFDRNGNPRIGDEREATGGVDAKMVIKDKFALDLTYNPDFSEVESDEPQVIINQRFEVLFPEKRPFFLENAGIFGTPYSLFFSRRILDPQYGARLTGRTGRWALGGLFMNDEDGDIFLPTDDENYGEDAQIAVARVQRDFGSASNVGVLVTDRQLGDYQNQVTGLDTRIPINDKWTFTGQAVSSSNEDPGAPDRDGELLFGQVTRAGREFNYDGQYVDIDREFDTQLGFVPRVDIKQLYQNASYLKQFPDAPWLVNMGPSMTIYRTWDQNDDLQDWSYDLGYQINGLAFTKFEAHYIESYEVYGGRFRKDGFSLSATSEWLKWMNFTAKYSQGENINYIPAEGLAPFLGDGRQFQLTASFKPHPQFRIDQTFIWDELRTIDAIGGVGADENIYHDVLSRTKFKYQFNRFLAAHLIIDYNATTPDSDLIALDRNRRVTGDILVSYLLNPGTALYVGYTDRQENLRLFGDPRILERTRDLDLHTGKQFFVKFSYLFGL
jgi:hypothetical protein